MDLRQQWKRLVTVVRSSRNNARLAELTMLEQIRQDHGDNQQQRSQHPTN
jgi:hypothetical protein